jgi:hypothetical protein
VGFFNRAAPVDRYAAKKMLVEVVEERAKF